VRACVSFGGGRFAVREMQCMHCGLVQPVQKSCAAEGCKKYLRSGLQRRRVFTSDGSLCALSLSLSVHVDRQLGQYYCNICHLWSDNPQKSIYHCADCGICRVGKGSRSLPLSLSSLRLAV
jgi:hypothetical protein